jgi:general secretion pathway protein D
VAVLRPLISANNTINANPGSNSLVITDYAENLQRIAKIIAALDQPAASEVDVIPLQHVVASDIATGAAPGRQRARHGRCPASRPAGATTVLADAQHQFADRARRQPGQAGGRAAVVAKLDRPAAAGGVPGGRHVGGAPEERRRGQAGHRAACRLPGRRQRRRRRRRRDAARH